jgi:hypothetical protein
MESYPTGEAIMNDPVEQFLASDFTEPAPPELRQAVLAGTTRVLRRRRLARRLAWATALAACFLAGMGTMLLWQTLEPSEQQAQRLPVSENVSAKQPETKAAPPTNPEPPLSLVDLEWRAFDSRENRAALFFEVARRYLDEMHDYDSAVRCYSQALDAAPKEQLAIRPNDNWLVMALKEARHKGEQ